MLHDGFSEMHRVEEGRADDCIGPASARLRAVPPGDTSNKGGQGADMLCGACVACGSEPRLPGKTGAPAGRWPAGERTSKEAGGVFAILGGNGVPRTLRGRLPPGCPLRSPRGFYSAALQAASFCGERSGADAPKFRSLLGDTSNKGGRCPPCAWSVRGGCQEGKYEIPLLTASLVTFWAFRKSPHGGYHPNKADVGIGPYGCATGWAACLFLIVPIFLKAWRNRSFLGGNGLRIWSPIAAGLVVIAVLDSWITAVAVK